MYMVYTETTWQMRSAISQAIIAEVQVHSQDMSCGIYGGQSGSGAQFFQAYQFSFHQCLYSHVIGG